MSSGIEMFGKIAIPIAKKIVIDVASDQQVQQASLSLFRRLIHKICSGGEKIDDDNIFE